MQEYLQLQQGVSAYCDLLRECIDSTVSTMRTTATVGFILLVVCIQLQLALGETKAKSVYKTERTTDSKPVTKSSTKFEKIPSPIGETYYLSKVDLLGDRLFGGARVLNISTSKCFDCIPLEILDDSSIMFENTGTFYSSITNDYSLGGELRRDFTLGFTLDKTSGHISSTNRTVKGTTLDIKAETLKCIVKPECLYNEDLHGLTPNFLNEFEKLPRTVEYLSDQDSWNFTAYERFLNEFGSHIVTGTTYGSRMYQHCFSKQEENYESRSYTVRTCVAFAGGNNITGANISTCAGITQEEADQSMTLNVAVRLVLRGGTQETRAKLSQERTSELIIQFLNEANYTDQPIEYDFTAVWTLLGQRYIGTEHYAKVRNLEAYYLGLQNFGCPLLWAQDGDGKWALQGFSKTDYSSTDIPSFQCYVPYQGCHSNHDCHYRDAFWCECSGDTCFRTETKTLNTGEQREYMRVVKDERWGGQGCELRPFFACTCVNGHIFEWRPIWEQDKDGADNGKMLHFLHHKFKLERSKRASGAVNTDSGETTRDEL